jgi:hypothetical protein
LEKIIPSSNKDSIPKVRFLRITEVNPASKPTTRLRRYIKFLSEMCLYLQISKRLKKEVLAMG